jgi:phosphatidate cytidylyltransferase
VPESKGSGEGEDLFEDLDKFFAPIQDVDWPETGEADAAAGRPAPEGADEAAADVPTAEPSSAEAEPLPAEPAATVEGQDDLFAETTASEPIAVWSAGGNVEAQASAGSGGSDESGFEDQDLGEDDAITEEAYAQAPSAYVDLPGPEEEDETVGELEGEEEAAEEVPPDLEAVEAAADHFAASVREEVRVEGDPNAVGAMTDEMAISSLLGDEGAEAEDVGEPEPARTVRVGPEGLGGPSWQEPTALEVGAEPERRAPGRDVPMAFLTGLILVAVALGAFAIGSGAFAVVAGAVVLFAQGEFYLALQKRHYQPATALGLVSGALVLAAGYYRGEPAMIAMVALGTFASFLWYMTVPVQHRRNVVSNVALTVLGIVYIPMLAGYALAVLRLTDGRGLAIAIIGLTIVYDIAAFGVGYLWGSRPLAPNVSPKKSWEGAIGATLVVIAVAVGAVAPLVGSLDTVGRSVGLAVVVAIFAPLGDLAESIVKRDLGLKDMGSILPGHGGVLDRIDALLFVAPAAFMFLRLILS